MHRRARVRAIVVTLVAVGTLIALVPVTASAQSAPTADPAAGARDAMKRLVSETRGLARSAANRRTRRALKRLAARAQRSALQKPCSAEKAIDDFRPALRKVSDDVKGPKAAAKAPAPPSPQGALLTAAFAADAALLQLPNSAGCGGGAAPAGPNLAVLPTKSDATGVTLRVLLPRARWTPKSGGGKDFTQIQMGDAESVGKVGEPGLPAFSQLLALPIGADATATVSNVESYKLEGVRPFPKQAEAVDGPADGFVEDVPPKVFADPPFKLDEKSYGGKAPIPVKLGEASRAGTMRDLSLAAVQIAGAQFKPSERRLEVLTRVDVRVDFRGANTGAFLSKSKRPRSAYEQSFPRVYKASVANSEAVAAETAQSDEDAQEFVAPCGEDMLIVTSPELRPAADTLAAARSAAGMVVAVKETGTAEGQIGTENTQIRDFIRGELNNDNCTRPTYVILLGDTSHVPTFTEPCPVSNCTDVPSDLSYSLDGIGNDPFADVLLGRISANTLPIANTVVSKIVSYETTPPAPPGDDFYNHATVTANFDGLGPVDGRTFTTAAETVRAGLRSRGHVVERLNSAQAAADIQQFSNGAPMPEEIRRPAISWTDGRDQIVNSFNDGRFFFMHRDHGSRLSWANPGININDVGLFQNGTQLPVVFAINCSSAGFQFPGNPSFDERLMNTPAGGAAGVFGDTEVSPSVPNTRLAIGFADALFPGTNPAAGAPEPLTRMGEVLLAGKVAMGNGAPVESQLTGNVYREHLLWHYLGDPSMQMWSATPAEFQNVQALYQPRSGTNPIDGPAFAVQLTLGPGTDGAIATLRNDGEAIGRAIVENGAATITPDRRTDSSGLTVALERDGFLTREVPVSAPAPTHTIQCPPTISSEFGVISRGQVLSSGGVPLKDGLVNLRFTTPGRTFTRSVLTDNEGRWLRQEPIQATDHGAWRIEAFFEDKGVKDAVCEFVVP